MGFRILQFPRQKSGVIHVKTIPPALIHPYAFARNNGFLSSWLDDDDSEGHANRPLRRINWGAISGMGLSLGVSAGFWIGLGLVIERIVK
jgi:cell division protein FtsW (lipid II flippase)